MNYSLLQDNKYSFFLLQIKINKYFLVVCSPSYTISVCPDYSYFHRKIILQLGMDISVVEDSLGMTSHLQRWQHVCRECTTRQMKTPRSSKRRVLPRGKIFCSLESTISFSHRNSKYWERKTCQNQESLVSGTAWHYIWHLHLGTGVKILPLVWRKTITNSSSQFHSRWGGISYYTRFFRK